jgi:nicotinamide-nucleotide amidase
VAARLTEVPGASDVLRGSLVSYASDVKFELLEVTPGPVVNEPVVAEMAEGAMEIFGASVGLALTGVAGPAEQDDVPVGTVCLGVAMSGSETITRQFRLPGDREQIRQFSVISALDLLRRQLVLRVEGVAASEQPDPSSRS